MASSGQSTNPSSRTIADKLGVKPDDAVVLVAAPAGFDPGPLPSGARLKRLRTAAEAPEGTRIAIAFIREAAQLPATIETLARRIDPDGMLWVAWPRRACGHESDVTDTAVRASALAGPLVDIKVAALGTDWSGLKLVWRKHLRQR